MCVSLDDHAVVQQYVNHTEQGQFCSAARSSSACKGTAALAGQRSRLDLKRSDIKYTFDLPVDIAEPHGRPNDYALGSQHVIPRHLFDGSDRYGGSTINHPLADGFHHASGPPVLGGVNYQQIRLIFCQTAVLLALGLLANSGDSSAIVVRVFGYRYFVGTGIRHRYYTYQ